MMKEYKSNPNDTFEDIVKGFANHYQSIIEPGHGLFFDFKDTPEYETLVLNFLIENYGWTLEKPFFIRKPL